MGIFSRKKAPSPKPPILRHLSSAVSAASSSSTPSILKASKKGSKGSLIRQISGRSEASAAEIIDKKTSRWEKKITKKVQKFKDEHPLVIKLAGALLVTAGASAATIPAVLAALGIKLAVIGIGAGATVGATSFFTMGATTTAVTHVGGAALAVSGAKVLAGTIAVDVGGRMINSAKTSMREGRPVQQQTSSKSARSSSPDVARANDMELIDGGVSPS